MIKLNQAHVSAICHAELFLEGALEKVESRRIKAALEADKLKLEELKLYIFNVMSQPQLPWKEPGINGKMPG